jgi:hypothetical protein
VSDITLGQLEVLLDSDERYARAARRDAPVGTRAAAELDGQVKAVRRALAQVPGMSALVRLLMERGSVLTPRPELTGEEVLTIEQVRRLRDQLSEGPASDVRRTLFPELWPLAVGDLTLPDAAAVLDKLQGHEAMRRPEFRESFQQLSADLQGWEEQLSPEEALNNYHDWAADIVRELPQLGTPPGEPPTRKPRPRPRQCRLKIARGVLLLDGEPIRLDMTDDARQATLCYLGHLIRMAGDWITGPEIDAAERKRPAEGLAGVRWDRVRTRLPEPVRDLTEAGGPKGYRLTSAAWSH